MTIIKSIYLWLIKYISFWSYKSQLDKNMMVIIVDFEEDINELLSFIEKERVDSNYKITVYYHSRIKSKLKIIKSVNYIEKNFFNKIKMIKSIQKSLFIIVDNYVVELGSIKLNTSKICIQIWHANGALKRFGLNKSNEYSPRDIKRFINVYKKYDKIIVGSEKMIDVFRDSFAINEEDIFMKIGSLRTDKYFREAEHKTNFKIDKSKKIILYTPTYRDTENELKLNINELNKLKTEGYSLVIRTHPAIEVDLPKSLSDFVINGNEFSLQYLIEVSDILVTDYSSIAMEFSILNKPIYFYCYDLELYKKETGLIKQFEKEICSPIYKDTPSLEEAILTKVVQASDVQIFNERWNTYTTGDACESLLMYLELRKKKYEVTN